jgi:hypothetical protein
MSRRVRNRLILAGFLLVIGVAARPGFAQVAAPDSARMRATGSRVSTEVAVLHIANRPVFEFRSSFLGYPPRKRLEAALDRVSGALQTGGGGKVTTDAVDLGVMMEVNGQMIFVVTPGDVDPLMQETLDDLVARTRADVQAAILAYREQRSLDSLISSILRALLATVIVARALQYLRRLVRWLTGVLERYASRRVQRLKLPPSGLTTQLVALVRLILRAAGVALAIIVVYSWLAYVLNQFPYTSPWGDQLGNYLSHTVVTVVMAILRSLPGLLMMVIIFALARLATRWLRMRFCLQSLGLAGGLEQSPLLHGRRGHSHAGELGALYRGESQRARRLLLALAPATRSRSGAPHHENRRGSRSSGRFEGR